MEFFNKKKEKKDEAKEENDKSKLISLFNEVKKKKPKQTKKREEPINRELNKFELIEKIENLKRQAESFRLKEDYENAIIIADRIMRLAIFYNRSDDWKEQEKFIKSISQKVQKQHLTDKIKEYASWLMNQYDKLVEANSTYQAHEMVESFKQTYEDLPYFESIQEAQEIIKKDTKEWLKYQANL
jgi:hypothetical protein